MPPKARHVPCPLCRTPTFSSHLRGGICIHCSDARNESREAAHSDAEARELARADLAVNVATLIAACSDKREELRAEREEQERLKKEEQKISLVQREIASRELARRSLLHFVERRVPNYKTAWVHELITTQLEEFLQEVVELKSPRMILCVPPRAGKRLINKTKILTANRGFTTHGDLKVGDYVFGLDGRPTKVVAVDVEGPCNMEIGFSTGESLICHENHEFLAKIGREDKVKKEYKVVEAKELLNTRLRNKVSEAFPQGKNNLVRVPQTPQLQYGHKALPVDPYVLAMHLSDGTTGNNRITHVQTDLEHINEVERRGYEVYHRSVDKTTGVFYSYIRDIGGGHFITKLRSMGLGKEKFIPEEYFTASVAQRLDFMSGFVDGDGTIGKDGTVFIQISSPVLRDGLVRMLRSLGESVWVHARPERTKWVRPAGRPAYLSTSKKSWTVGYNPRYPGLNPMLPRKKERLRTFKKQLCHYVTSVRRLDDTEIEQGKCIQVAAPDGMYLVGETLIPTHNSELASVSFPMWALGKHPDLKFILASHSGDLPMQFSRQIREGLQNPDYRELFPHGAKMSPDDASAKSWTTVQGGGVRTVGVGAGLLGFGANILVVDDPIATLEFADTPEALLKLWDWFGSVAYSRLQPGGGVIVIQQRMSYDDLVGRLTKRQAEEEARVAEMHQEIKELSLLPQTEETVKELVAREEEVEELEASMDRWRLIEYPAIATADEYYDHTAGQIMRLPPGSTPDSRWKSLRKRGEALDPRRYSRSYLLKIKRNNPRMFATMYMLSPTLDEGAYFSHPDFLRHVSHPKLETLHVYCCWDLAIGVKQTNDYTVGVAGGIDCNGKLWLLDLVRGRFGDVRDIADRVIDMHTKWGASQTGIEHTHVAMALKPILKTRMQERNQHIVLAEGKEKLVATSDKAVRARSLQGLCRGGKFSVPEGEIYDEFIGELTRFDGRGTSGHDDCVDAASWLAILALRTAPPRNPKADLKRQSEEEYQNWMDELLDELGPSHGETFMCR